MLNKTKKRSGEGETILIIEDERPLVSAIQTKLEKSGFVTVTARTVEQGLQYLEDINTIDAIWLDHYLLGKEDGLYFVAKLKNSDSKWNKIPIFVVSNTASSTNVGSYIRLGVSKYFVKAEHRLDKIVEEVKDFLKNSKE
jgi:DNA-binding response OmpR family regulator